MRPDDDTGVPMNGKMFLLVLVASLLFCAPSITWSEPGEYQVKAAYLYHFAKFVEWPSDAASASLNICVIGKSPFGSALSSISGKKVRNRSVVISYLNRIDELKECDILFVCASEKARLSQILAAMASRPTLTVSDLKHFASAGGMIGFVSVSDKLRFEINQRAAQRAGLRVSAQLLKLATMVVE
jgi:hypothetical protein